MANKLSNPAQNVDNVHKVELGEAKIKLIAMRQPFDIAQHHGWPPPEGHCRGDLPVNEKIGGAHTDIDPESRPDLVAKEGYLKAKFDLRPPVAHHNVPSVNYDRHANYMDDLIDLVAMEFAIVENHVIPVHAFVLSTILPLQLGQFFFCTLSLSFNLF